MSIRTSLIKVHWILSTQFGFDPRVLLRSLRGLPRYVQQLVRFRSTFTGRMVLQPCLHDWYEEGGTTKSEYFWQDLLVARMIFETKPDKHVDVGSRVDGFVAHVASFRDIEVFDVRPITTQIPGVVFRQADLMKPLDGLAGYCDSLSCLHALEHFGLGRYGDPIDPEGFTRGFANMATVLKENGTLYLSVPIGTERVEFNSHRVSAPRRIVDLAGQHSLSLSAFTVIRPGGRIETLARDEKELSALGDEHYALGIFVFRKHGTS